MKSKSYSTLMAEYKGYIDTMNAIYCLKTNDEAELSKIYNDIKTNLLETGIFKPERMIYAIALSCFSNGKYLKGYLSLCMKIKEEYHAKEATGVPPFFDYFAHKEYGIVFHTKNYQFLDKIHETDISWAILNDDKYAFISITESEDFNKDELIPYMFDFTGLIKYSLLETCCISGAVECFKILRSKYKSKITDDCLSFAFMSGNPDIMSECLKTRKPTKNCMSCAIISHNIDFVTFLMNQYKLEIDLIDCLRNHNLQALLVYADKQRKGLDLVQFFIVSVGFNIPSLSKYIISLGVNLFDEKQAGNMALFTASNFASYKNAKFLLKEGVNVSKANIQYSNAIHAAVRCGMIDIVELLLSHGADINMHSLGSGKPIADAIRNCDINMVEFLISHGAKVSGNVNFPDEPLLSIAIRESTVEIVELLISKGARFSYAPHLRTTVLEEAIDSERRDMQDHFYSKELKKVKPYIENTGRKLIFEIIVFIFIVGSFYFVGKRLDW